MPEIERIMERICDLCHHPYVETDQEALDEICSACTLEAEIRALVQPVTITIEPIPGAMELLEKLEEKIVSEKNARRLLGL